MNECVTTNAIKASLFGTEWLFNEFFSFSSVEGKATHCISWTLLPSGRFILICTMAGALFSILSEKLKLMTCCRIFITFRRGLGKIKDFGGLCSFLNWNFLNSTTTNLFFFLFNFITLFTENSLMMKCEFFIRSFQPQFYYYVRVIFEAYFRILVGSCHFQTI